MAKTSRQSTAAATVVTPSAQNKEPGPPDEPVSSASLKNGVDIDGHLVNGTEYTGAEATTPVVSFVQFYLSPPGLAFWWL